MATVDAAGDEGRIQATIDTLDDEQVREIVDEFLNIGFIVWRG